MFVEIQPIKHTIKIVTKKKGEIATHTTFFRFTVRKYFHPDSTRKSAIDDRQAEKYFQLVLPSISR